MTNLDANQPQIDRKLVLVGLFGFSTAYALLLSTKVGRKWADDQTWATVVGGVMMVTGAISLEDPKAAKLNFIYFFAAGIPIIFRSLWLQLEKWDTALNAHLPR